jgi:hypothetical protein
MTIRNYVERDEVQLPLAQILRDKGYKVELEVPVSDGRIDILTPDEIIECKQTLTRESGYSASGQLDYYSAFFPHHAKAVAVREVKDHIALDRLGVQGIKVYDLSGLLESEPVYSSGYSYSSYGSMWFALPEWVYTVIAVLIIGGCVAGTAGNSNSNVTVIRPSDVSVLATQPGGMSKGQTIEVVAARANVRAGPSTNYPVIGTVTKGYITEVITSETVSGWIEIQNSEGQTGWLFYNLVRAK